MRILLVEDCEVYAYAIRNANSSHEVLVAPTLAQAHQYMTLKPSLVILDLSLPDSEGLSTLEALLTYGRPCVVLTATTDLACEAGRMGAMDYITKDDNNEMLRRISFNIERLTPKRPRFNDGAFEQVKAYLRCPEWAELMAS